MDPHISIQNENGHLVAMIIGTESPRPADENYPRPWRVEYWQRCDEWHPKSSPRIVASNGARVCNLMQNVGHPGAYDAEADALAHLICCAVNQ